MLHCQLIVPQEIDVSAATIAARAHPTYAVGLALAALAACAEVASAAPPAAHPADWPAYNRTLAGDRYSPLAEITTANVGQLTLRCAYTLPELAAFQTGPLVIGGTLYFTTFEGSYAVDASS